MDVGQRVRAVHWIFLHRNFFGGVVEMKIYGLICDSGDGSAYLRWYKNKNVVDKLLDEDSGNEEFYMNEGSPSEELTFPDDFDLEAAGFTFSDGDDE